jgi:hypothetical protein
VALCVNPPVKMGPVLLPDRPWETMDIGFCVRVLQDGPEYKMWYMARDRENEIRICYARSKDGMAWEKPNLGQFDYKGSKQNNIVMTGVIETTVFLDPVAAPEARFKAVAMMHWPDPQKAGIYVHTSPDGIRWKISDRRVFPVAADTANQAFYDTRLKRYVANIRVWAPLRKVGRIEMDDITQPWPHERLEKPFYIWGNDKIPVASREVPIVFSYDERDPVESDHYNAACVEYPWADAAYFLFPSAYRHYPEPPVGKLGNDGLLDIQMAVSRDGIHWNRLSRAPYVPLGLDHEIDSRQLYMAVGMVRSGPHVYQYYGGYNVTHGAIEPAKTVGSICCVRQRLDGFVSADGAFEGGEFVTPPLVFSGKRLVLNVNTSAMGTCRVEILDDHGTPLPGYRMSDCDEIGGNFIEKAVTWKGKSDLGPLAGRTVQLRFALRAGKLFAFQFAR